MRKLFDDVMFYSVADEPERVTTYFRWHFSQQFQIRNVLKRDKWAREGDQHISDDILANSLKYVML